MKSTGNLKVTAHSDAAAGATGILALNDFGYGTGKAITVRHTGDIVATAKGGLEGPYTTSTTAAGVVAISASRDLANASAIEIVTKGDISARAEGDRENTAAGIYARSVAELGRGGDIHVKAQGDITGTNTGDTGFSAGIFARSYGNGGLANGDIRILFKDGTLVGSTAGIIIEDGRNNVIKSWGTVTGLNGVAILSDTGNETVDNYGIVTGDVLLGTGTNAFNNMEGGLFNSGATVNLGDNNVLKNDGTLSPGGKGTVLTTALTGDLAQTGGGEFLVDLHGANADRVNVVGVAELDGKVRANFTLSDIDSAKQWTVLTTDATPITDNGIKAVSTPVVQFDLIFPTATQMDLVLLDVNFAVNGLNRNETAIAKNFNKTFSTGNFASLDAVMNALAFLPAANAVANALDQLSPEIYLDTEIATLFSGLAFTNNLMSCPVREGVDAFIKEGQCVWTQVSGRSFEQDQTFQTLGFDEASWQISGGGQVALGQVWRLGFALGYEHGKLETDTTAKADSDRLNGGVALKYNPGALLLTAAVAGGQGWYDTDRRIAFPGFSALAHANHDVSYVNGRFRAAYLVTSGSWYAKPLVDFDATHVSLDNVNEHGAGGASLNVRGNDETVLSATPALELGTQFGANGVLVRPYVRGGATFFDDPDFVLSASFAGAPSGVGSFRIATSTDDVVGNVGAGVDVINGRGHELKLFYEGRFSDLVEEHAGGIKASLPF
jgi:uncharacterized protein with beta-barrel porin domain